jgi:hypothetical protein
MVEALGILVAVILCAFLVDLPLLSLKRHIRQVRSQTHGSGSSILNLDVDDSASSLSPADPADGTLDKGRHRAKNSLERHP